MKKIVLAGGVSANKHLQTALADAVGGIGASLVHPTPILCTDNAVMIACRGYFMYVFWNCDYVAICFRIYISSICGISRINRWMGESFGDVG